MAFVYICIIGRSFILHNIPSWLLLCLSIVRCLLCGGSLGRLFGSYIGGAGGCAAYCGCCAAAVDGLGCVTDVG